MGRPNERNLTLVSEPEPKKKAPKDKVLERLRDPSRAELFHNKRKDAYDNLVRAATVQTIGFYTQDGREVLQRIAQDNGGTFRYVAPPPGIRPQRARKKKNR